MAPNEINPDISLEIDNQATDKDKDTNLEMKEEKKEAPMVSVLSVFRYSTGLDKFLMSVGAFGAICHGISLPGFLIVFGTMLDTFLSTGDVCEVCANISTVIDQFNINQTLGNSGQNFTCDAFFSLKEADTDTVNGFLTYSKQYFAARNVSSDEFVSDNQNDLLDRMVDHAIYYIIIGAGTLFCSYLQVTFWAMPAKRQARRIRLLFFRAALRQNIGWFDTNPAGELSTRLSDDIDKIENGIGDKIGILFQLASQTVGCIAGGFYYGWLLTLVILAASPLIAIAASIVEWVSKTSTVQEQAAYAEAGGIAEEVLSAIRTVIAFGGQSKECDRYNSRLNKAKQYGIRKGAISGVAMGFLMSVMFLSYALGFWFGAGIILGDYLPELHKEFTIGKMLLVFFNILVASFSLGQAGPAIKDLATARGAAYFVFNLIERVPEIDIESLEGEKPAEVSGKIEFKDVHFQYPSRPDVKVLRGLNLEVPVGKTVALVGSSGCGKSTTVQLIQRFYDVASGSILLDGKDVKDLNVRWLRSQVGIVSQEPVLFATTIAENIRYGKDGVTHAEIVQAAKEANAHFFIDGLPDKYDTLVGDRGAQLSGGQKQRIAIARALVNSPKVLLLDEATSALDTESEKIVQEALDKASHGRTTIVIAHRLTTVQNADIIVAIKDSVAVEQGTHSELMAKEGVYAALINKQMNKESKHSVATSDDDSDDEEEELEKEMELVKLASQKVHDMPQRILSVTSTHEETVDVEFKDKLDVEKAKDVPPVGFCELMSWNASEWYLILIGCLGALVEGGSQPAFAVVLSKMLSGFISCDESTQRKNANFYSLMFVAIAAALFIFTALEKVMFSISGERLTERVRKQAFKAYLRQDVHFFDDPKNSTGALTTRLSIEASAIQGATGPQLGGAFQAFANLGVGIIIAFTNSWVLTLAILAIAPVIGISGYIEMKLFQGGATKDKELFEASGKIAAETISNIRTVQGLGKEQLFYDEYAKISENPYKKELKKTQTLGISYGVSQGIFFFANAVIFYLGAWLIAPAEPGQTKIEQISFEEMMITFSAVMFGALALGEATSFAPNYRKGAAAAGYIKRLINIEPQIDAYAEVV